MINVSTDCVPIKVHEITAHCYKLILASETWVECSGPAPSPSFSPESREAGTMKEGPRELLRCQPQLLSCITNTSNSLSLDFLLYETNKSLFMSLLVE